jgi:hypothetical protein
MGPSFLAGEKEYLKNIEKIIMSKPENKRERMRSTYYRNWKKRLDIIFNIE